MCLTCVLEAHVAVYMVSGVIYVRAKHGVFLACSMKKQGVLLVLFVGFWMYSFIFVFARRLDCNDSFLAAPEGLMAVVPAPFRRLCLLLYVIPHYYTIH